MTCFMHLVDTTSTIEEIEMSMLEFTGKISSKVTYIQCIVIFPHASIHTDFAALSCMYGSLVLMAPCGTGTIPPCK